MRLLVTLVRNLTVALLAVLRNILKLLGLRPGRPDWVAFDLREDPPYRPLPWRIRFGAALTGRSLETDLHTLSRRLDVVAKDRKVRGVLLRLDGLSTSLAKIEDLAKLVRRLKLSGKRVLIWTPHASVREAPLLFSGDGLYLSVAGRLELQGFALQATSAAPALEWMGLGVTVVRRGLYKSAADTFLNEDASDELQETLGRILDDLFEMASGSLAVGRGLSQEEAAVLLDRAPWTGEQALNAGVVDGVCYWDELVRNLEADKALPGGSGDKAREASGAAPVKGEGSAVEQADGAEEAEPEEGDGKRKKAKVASWPEFRASRLSGLGWKPLFSARQVIGVLHLKGLIVEGESRHVMGSSVVGHRSVAEALAHARRMRSVKAVMLHIESRGGSALASDLMWREIRRTAKEKPVVAFMDTVAASGGYYCAAAANSIVAAPFCLTGSIGVISVVFETSRLASGLGVNREIFQRGARAAVGNTSRPPTQDELKSLEEDVDSFYEIFLDRVAKGRGLTRDEVVERAEGRVFTGLRAKKVSLVDELGGFEDALEKAKSLAGISPERSVPLLGLDVGGAGLGRSMPVEWGLSRGQSPFAAGARFALGLDDFDVAWLGVATTSPGTAWAVLPHRLV